MAVNIVVPEMGESIVDARIAKWLKAEGDAVRVGEPLVELETDKVDVEVPAPQNGVLEKIAQAAGADVKIGEVLGTIADGAAAAAPAPSPAAPAASAARGAKTNDRGVAATPSARKAAREAQIEIGSIRSEGPRVTRADVDKSSTPVPPPPAAPAGASVPAPAAIPASSKAPAAPPPAPAPRPLGERVEERSRMSKRRATIAKRLVEAQHVAAMLTTFNEVDMSAVMALRERHKDVFKAQYGVGLGIASFFVKAAIAALHDFPRLNAEIQGDEIVLKRYYDVGVAVSAAEGLVVPVLRDANLMSFAEIELGIRTFAQKAKEGTLTLDDLRGGTFSITNGGVFGSLMSTPIINPPQVGILGLHAIKDRPVGVGGQVVLRPMMYTALTYDHRIVDGSEAVRFLVRIKELVEDPGVLLVQS
jgi:2-oxoglutarate dehydrogenase E2 component (dihydrolipoamide succinyltransferase)